MIERADITGVVLAGGRGSRLGGVDKGWVALDGRPLIEHALSRLTPSVGSVVISANRHLDRYRGLGYPVVEDRLPDHPGPLVGLLSTMQQIESPWTLVMPVDMPWLPSSLVAVLAVQCADEVDILVADDGERLQPLVALLRTSLRDDLATWLAGGEAKVLRWYERHAWRGVDFSAFVDRFVNVNTPEECRIAEARMRIGERADGR